MSSIVVILAAAMLVLCIVRLLVLRPPPAAKLPDPATLGMPTAGPASVKSAHAALSRRGSGSRPKFRT
jgi:hypothetical protein